MVKLAEIKAAYYMVAATGVLIAAVFYVLLAQHKVEPWSWLRMPNIRHYRLK